MGNISGDTVVELTVKQIMAFLCGLLIIGGAVLWTVLSFTIGGMREDVGAIRSSIAALQSSDKDAAIKMREAEARFTDQVGNLRTEIAGLGGKIDTFSSRVQNLDTSVGKVAAQLQDVQKALLTRSANLSDPRNAQAIATALKQVGVDDAKVFVVPLDGMGPAMGVAPSPPSGSQFTPLIQR